MLEGYQMLLVSVSGLVKAMINDKVAESTHSTQIADPWQGFVCERLGKSGTS